MRTSSAFFVAVLISGAANASTNLLTNGSFETPVVPVGGFLNYASGSSSITGWTVVGPQVSIVSGSYVSAGLTFPASDGKQWLDLTGDLSNSVEGVEQSVATVAGTTYNLSFDVGNQVNPGGPYGTTSAVKVLVNGSVLGTFTNSGVSGSTSQSWESFNTSFKASGASTIVEFLNQDPSTDNTNGLDNVALTGVAGAPEPATLGLLGLGLAGVGLCRRRRKS